MNSLKSQKTLTVKGLLVLMLALAVVSIAAPFASAAAGDVNIIIRAETDADGKGLQLIDANINIRCEGLAVDGNSKASIAGGPGVAYASFALLTDMGGTATESSCADNDRIDVNIRFNRGLKGFISLDTNFTYDTAADPNYFDVNEDRSLSSVTGAGIKFKLKARTTELKSFFSMNPSIGLNEPTAICSISIKVSSFTSIFSTVLAADVTEAVYSTAFAIFSSKSSNSFFSE